MADSKPGTDYVFLYWDTDIIETKINKVKMAKKPKGGKKVKY